MNNVSTTFLLRSCFLSFIFAAITSAEEPAPIPYGSNAQVGKYYDINGFKMYTEVYGSGPPLLMLHGNNNSMKAFARNVPYLAKHYQVILADSRSQGKSLDPDHPLHFEMMADDFSSLLDAMHIDSANIVGWSDGGIDAILMAMRHPEKVKRFVTSGANVSPDADAFRPGFWEREKATYESDVNKPRTTPNEKNGWKIFLLDWQEPHISPAQLHKIQCPAMIVCGDHDLIAISHTVMIYQSLPHANLWVIPNSGHLTLSEHADEFDKKIDEFFTMPFVDHH